MDQIEVGIIGTGWCGGIRAVASVNSAMVSKLHIAEVNPDRLAEVAALTDAATATTQWEDLVSNPDISAIMVSAWSSARATVTNLPPSEKESGVTFRIPMMRGPVGKLWRWSRLTAGILRDSPRRS